MTPQPTGSPFDRVGIIGLGLMGGSLARSLKTLPSPPHIRALSDDPLDLERALAAGAIDQMAMDAEVFFEGLDLVVYCTPLKATLELLAAHHHRLQATGTVITDVVSLKTPILNRIKALGLHGSFVGSHPMCGGEGSGFSLSTEDLFSGARVWMVAEGAPLELVQKVKGFWMAVGARGEVVDASDHDASMVWVSHLPQITACALARVLGEAGIRREELGPGGKDMTRLAGSQPGMWRDLLEYAPEILPEALGAVEAALAETRRLIQEDRGDEVADIMRRTKEWSEGGTWS